MQFKRTKKNVNGVILLDKPHGFSSNQALQKVKWLYQAAKAGHTGTLDPLATGLLPICLGEATKFAQIITNANKAYLATVKLGVTTTTGDAEGEVIATKIVNVTAQQFNQAAQQFLGEITQIPPIYSALKVEGKPMYAYARAGLEVERKPRKTTIFEIQLIDFKQDIATILVACSKGTYIRTLAEDIGNALNCGAHLIGLRRTATATYTLQNVTTLEALEALSPVEREALLLPVDSAILHLPQIILNADTTFFLQQGQPVWISGKIPSGDLRLYDENSQFLGLGVMQDDGKIAPKRLLRNH